ncbi:MAG TPA: hypothetical protein VE089_04575 [Nitrososphaeraceae archaeon]|jgi:hypothetical protein|nr:hypothetical protein [Nitrososphaeraceae archaeon]
MSEWLKNNKEKSLIRSDEVDQLLQVIMEQNSEQKKLVDTFNKTMNEFATERSLETCLEALNTSMQIASIRAKLVESYEFYARLLEREIIRLSKQ